jgi:hypothetical protein
MRRLSHAASLAGAIQPLSRRLGDARRYWSGEADPRWLANSHWRRGLDEDAWLEIGQESLTIFDQFAKALDRPSNPGVVVEWGCGGGANAVAFAPIAKKFIAADVSGESVAECIRQIAAVCDTPTESVLIDIEHPERAVTGLEETCDTFVCLNVLQLTAGPAEAVRILRIAERLLVSGGIAFVQTKYHTANWRTRGRKRNYWLNLGDMTTFGIDEFWLCAAECGLTPRLITLVPKHRLDSRFAYYALTKP